MPLRADARRNGPVIGGKKKNPFGNLWASFSSSETEGALFGMRMREASIQVI